MCDTITRTLSTTCGVLSTNQTCWPSRLCSWRGFTRLSDVMMKALKNETKIVHTLLTLTENLKKSLSIIFILVLRVRTTPLTKAVHLRSYSNPYSLTHQGGTVCWVLVRPTSRNANFSQSFLITKILLNISISFVKFIHRPRCQTISISNSWKLSIN